MGASSVFQRGAATSPHYLASRSGLRILQAGGNAVEAAVAMAATLAAVYPHMTGIGGDGFWLIRSPDGDVFAIDASGAAAAGADLDLYRSAGVSSIPFRGPLAALTVAGTVSGWALALEKADGVLPLAELLADAIGYAEAGTTVTVSGAKAAQDKDPDLKDVFGYAGVFRPEGRPVSEGDTLKQPQLAVTLRRLADEGLDAFYRGSIAIDLAQDLAEAGSPLTADDLNVHQAALTTPLTVRVGDADLYNMGPPTQGFCSLLMLALFDRLEVKDDDGFAHLHGLVEAFKRGVLAYRDIGLGDAGYMSADPQAFLDDGEKLDQLAAEIDPDAATPWPHQTQSGDTTWFGAADEAGWVVSAIQSVYFEFGSGVVLPKTGVTWQNRGASFRLVEDGWNALRPGRKPFHTLNPALARFDDGRIMAYGAMGGEGQPQTQAAIYTRYAQHGMDLQDAVSAPRWLLGRTWGDVSTSLKLEDRFDDALVASLRAAGHDVETLEPFSEVMGHAGAVVRRADGTFIAASDPRSDGEAAGW